MGRKNRGDTVVKRLTCPPDAPPEMVAIFKKFCQMESSEAVIYLYKSSQGQISHEEEIIDEEDDFDDILADFMPS